MERCEATGATATASILRELAGEIEQGFLPMGDDEMPVSNVAVSLAADGTEVSAGRVVVTVQVEARPDRRTGEMGQASELERELAHPGD